MPRSSQRDLLSQREVQVTCHYSQCVVDQLGVPWICSRAKELEFQSFVHNASSLRKSEGHQEMRNGTSLVSQCKESACQCSRHEFNPWSRKIPHATEQLSLWATAIKPVPVFLASVIYYKFWFWPLLVFTIQWDKNPKDASTTKIYFSVKSSRS